MTITYMKGDGTTNTQTLTVASALPLHGEGEGHAGRGRRRRPRLLRQGGVHQRAADHRRAPHVLQLQRESWTGGHDVVGATSPAPTFYFAEGTCRPNFDPYFCIQNPGAADADVTITYMKGDGTTDTQTLTVAKNSRSTVRVKDMLGEGDDAAHDFSAKVECTNGQQIVAERPMYFNYKRSHGPADTTWWGRPRLRTTFYFAEGTCRPDFDPYICIQNPGELDADVTITYMKGDGTTNDQTSRCAAELPLHGEGQGHAGRGRRRRPRLLRQGGVHQRSADHRRAPDVLQLQRELLDRADTTWWAPPRPRTDLLLRRGHLPARLRPLPLHPEPGRSRRRRDDHLHEGRRHHQHPEPHCRQRTRAPR